MRNREDYPHKVVDMGVADMNREIGKIYEAVNLKEVDLGLMKPT